MFLHIAAFTKQQVFFIGFVSPILNPVIIIERNPIRYVIFSLAKSSCKVGVPGGGGDLSPTKLVLLCFQVGLGDCYS